VADPERPANGARERVLFISHKHTDKDVADEIREFVEGWTGGRVRVFQSSAAEAAGPRIGRRLSDELKQALREAGVVLFLHTRSDDDWSTCMWEIGVATDPGDPNTKVILLACGDDTPVVFDDQVRVNVRHFTDVHRLVNDLLTSRQYFPGFEEPATAFASGSQHMERATRDLLTRLEKVLPPPGAEPERVSWPYPFLRLQLNFDQVRTIEEAEGSDRLRRTVQILEESALVLQGDHEAGRVFGVTGAPQSILLKKLIGAWSERTATPDSKWVEGLARQIMDGAVGQYPTLRWELLHGADKADGTWYGPAVTRARRVPAERVVEFDVCFCKFEVNDDNSLQVGVPATEGD
jgi:hypothetical protein